jgi:hypothetical protein
MSFKNEDVATLLSHLSISNKGNELIANLSMTRAEASVLMRKNFGNSSPTASEKQPEDSKANLINGF